MAKDARCDDDCDRLTEVAARIRPQHDQVGPAGARLASPGRRASPSRSSGLSSTLIAALDAALAQQEEGEEPERNAQVEEEEAHAGHH